MACTDPNRTESDRTDADLTFETDERAQQHAEPEPPGSNDDFGVHLALDPALDPFCQRVHCKWLGQDLHTGIEVTVADHRVFGIPVDEQYLQVGTQRARRGEPEANTAPQRCKGT